MGSGHRSPTSGPPPLLFIEMPLLYSPTHGDGKGGLAMAFFPGASEDKRLRPDRPGEGPGQEWGSGLWLRKQLLLSQEARQGQRWWTGVRERSDPDGEGGCRCPPEPSFR